MSQTVSRIEKNVVQSAALVDPMEDTVVTPSCSNLSEEPSRTESSYEPTLDVSIVVPYYNPGELLRPTIESVMRVLSASGATFEIIAVSDGCSDNSQSTLDGLPERVVRRISYPTNVGKGYALRIGFGEARGLYVGFIDADGDISPEFLTNLLAIMREDGPDIVIGTKRHPDSAVHNGALRRAYSWGYQSLIRILFSLDVGDTQVGVKLMDRRVVDDLLPLLRENRFALDLELLVLARNHGYAHIVEAPVRIDKRSQSTVSLKAVRSLLVDTMAIFWRSSRLVEGIRPGTPSSGFASVQAPGSPGWVLEP
jgi:glycosyltransferase involved in cell wall biosynthesis